MSESDGYESGSDSENEGSDVSDNVYHYDPEFDEIEEFDVEFFQGFYEEFNEFPEEIAQEVIE
jgi:hypothetical protein